MTHCNEERLIILSCGYIRSCHVAFLRIVSDLYSNHRRSKVKFQISINKIIKTDTNTILIVEFKVNTILHYNLQVMQNHYILLNMDFDKIHHCNSAANIHWYRGNSTVIPMESNCRHIFPYCNYPMVSSRNILQHMDSGMLYHHNKVDQMIANHIGKYSREVDPIHAHDQDIMLVRR